MNSHSFQNSFYMTSYALLTGQPLCHLAACSLQFRFQLQSQILHWINTTELLLLHPVAQTISVQGELSSAQMYKAATLPSLSSLLTLTPVSATKQAGTDGSFSTDLAPLFPTVVILNMFKMPHFALLLFLLQHKSQDPLTPHGKILANTKLWQSLPRAASRCLAALLSPPGLFGCWL